jgi:hypothetical protein
MRRGEFVLMAALAAAVGLSACKPAGSNGVGSSISAASAASVAAAASSQPPAGPAIQITLVLSPAAAAQIAQTGQTITLPAVFYGMPTDPNLRAQLEGRLPVGPEQDVVVNGAGAATILIPPLDQAKIAQVENGQAEVAIDVSSGNHTTQNNLLNCDPYMDVPLQQAESQPTTIHCKLIGEP